MVRTDYNDAMLGLYFKEKSVSLNARKRLLESNPFDANYVEWERNTMYNNRTFAVLMKKYGLVDYSDRITEVLVHTKNSSTKGFPDVFYSLCGANDKLSVDIRSGRVIVIKGLYRGEEECLRKLKFYRYPFIVGDTNTGRYYDEERETFGEIANNLGLSIIEEKNSKNNTILLKSR